MAEADDVDGVLITGVYGTGKSAVAAEVAETLERRGVPYGAIDLDWLTWFEVPGMDDAAANRVYLANVADVVRNYRMFGVVPILSRGMRRSFPAAIVGGAKTDDGPSEATVAAAATPPPYPRSRRRLIRFDDMSTPNGSARSRSPYCRDRSRSRARPTQPTILSD